MCGVNAVVYVEVGYVAKAKIQFRSSSRVKMESGSSFLSFQRTDFSRTYATTAPPTELISLPSPLKRGKPEEAMPLKSLGL